ncbi:GNAT family N-acetyltransferase [Paractinoplanes lichenicola]|uniref:GNAT family N-acetyltransferase n=1 Tax=Paractinoplanes lichenicola TaxID=2802976 RepID=A0ABS1VZS1_9ACTN|nr:GNAT family N-acetyltransferase [Actinoplanes lichenicola]MBL7259985.1 GNAT family N-acetyltransferase [Actinoplanes lichenicola]
MTTVQAGLDDPVVASLRGEHSKFAQTYGRAIRYDPQVAPFHAVEDPDDPQAWADLAALTGPGAEVAVAGPIPKRHPGWEIAGEVAGVQFVDESLAAAPLANAQQLTPSDVPEILALIELTQPGPFRQRTIELGTYLGVRENGVLIAIAGERLHPPGWTEISAVCTHPAFRGQGLATRLVQAVAYGIRQRGEVPFLHTSAANANAIRLYESIGFRLRKRTTFAVYKTSDA